MERLFSDALFQVDETDGAAAGIRAGKSNGTGMTSCCVVENIVVYSTKEVVCVDKAGEKYRHCG